MTHADTSLMGAFENGTIDPGSFGHREHLRVIWSFVHAYGTLEAVRRFEEGLKRLTADAGHPEKYHATITHAFTFLVSERIHRQGTQNWNDFEEVNADLFAWPNATLADLYPAEVLASAEARATFVMPKLAAAT
ncbi:MAG: hypothetical protein AAF567_01550 [Actinomycetota bacterium]